MAAPHITLVEVGPRDGLQNEKTPFSTADKITLCEKLIAAGAQVVEAGAFVSPKWVPQMAGSDAVLAGVLALKAQNVRLPVLVPNAQGYQAAKAARAREIAVFTAASETFNQKNTNATIAQSLERFAPVLAQARADGITVRGYVSCVVGCPYEGPISPAAVADVTAKLFAMGCFEVSLGDTIGVGTPKTVGAMLDAVLGVAPAGKLALHMHDTYGMAVANIAAGLGRGITVFDSAVGGLGGCPYAPGAGGNVASEDVVYFLQGQGLECGINLEDMVKTAWWASSKLGRAPASKVAKAVGAKLGLAHGC